MIANTNKINANNLASKIVEGVDKAVRKLVETSAAKNESLVISDKDGNIKKVPAKELLKDLSK
jgi:hypothetical protein